MLIREVRLRSTPTKEQGDGRDSTNVSDMSLNGSLLLDANNERTTGGGRSGRGGDGWDGDENESVANESDCDGDIFDVINGNGNTNSDNSTAIAVGRAVAGAVAGGSGRNVREVELEARLAELEQRYTEQRCEHEAALAALVVKHADAMGKLSFLLRDGVMERLEQALTETEVRLVAGVCACFRVVAGGCGWLRVRSVWEVQSTSTSLVVRISTPLRITRRIVLYRTWVLQ